MTRGSADLYRCKDTLKIPSTHAAYPCSIFNVKLCYVQCDWYLNLQWRAEICGYPGDNFMFWMDVKDHLLRFRCPHSWFPKLMFCSDAHLCYRHQVDNPVCATTPPPPHLFFHLCFSARHCDFPTLRPRKLPRFFYLQVSLLHLPCDLISRGLFCNLFPGGRLHFLWLLFCFVSKWETSYPVATVLFHLLAGDSISCGFFCVLSLIRALICNKLKPSFL